MQRFLGTQLFRSKKTFKPLSVAFRNWRATSHCNLIHGYGLVPTLYFVSASLDDLGWVMDYGGFKQLYASFEEKFDHKLVVAADDPELVSFQQIEKLKMAELTILPLVSTEYFAHHMMVMTKGWMKNNSIRDSVQLEKVILEEHQFNAAEAVNDLDEDSLRKKILGIN